MSKIKAGRKSIGHYEFKPKGDTALKLQPGPQQLSWEQIRPRSDLDTRSLTPQHILSLARSIAAVGLIQPLAVDTKGRLIAGAHRLAVWSLLSIADPQKRRAAFLDGLVGYESPKDAVDEEHLSEPEQMAKELAELDLAGWKEAHPDDKVPVLVFNEDGSRSKNLALQREVAENEKRRNYTGKEVQALAERLKKAGFTDLKGRPEEDQKSVRAELARILGKSSRQVRRYLNDPEVAKPKGGHGVHLSRAHRALSKLDKILPAIEKGLARDADAKQVLDAATKLAKAVETYQARKAEQGS